MEGGCKKRGETYGTGIQLSSMRDLNFALKDITGTRRCQKGNNNMGTENTDHQGGALRRAKSQKER